MNTQPTQEIQPFADIHEFLIREVRSNASNFVLKHPCGYNSKDDLYSTPGIKYMKPIPAMAHCLRELKQSILAAGAFGARLSAMPSQPTYVALYEAGLELLATATGLTPKQTEVTHVKGGIA